jgi:hypothetical protein
MLQEIRRQVVGVPRRSRAGDIRGSKEYFLRPNQSHQINSTSSLEPSTQHIASPTIVFIRNSIVKCAICGRPHTTFELGCQLFKAACERRVLSFSMNFLRILHANLHKMLETQSSLLNDEDLADFRLLPIREPYCWYIDEQIPTTPRYYPYRRLYIPTTYGKEH